MGPVLDGLRRPSSLRRPQWNGALSALDEPLTSVVIRTRVSRHPPTLAEGWSAKLGLDIPNQNCRINGTLLGEATHIAEVRRKSVNYCAAALAVMDATGDPAAINGKVILLFENSEGMIAGRGKRYRVPKKLRRFVEQFDEGRPVQPFKFKLRPWPREGE